MPSTLNEQQFIVLVTQFTDLAIRYGLDLLGAIAILIIGKMVAGWAHRSVLSLLSKTGRVDDTLKPFFANTVRYLILVLVVIAVLSQFGIQTASLIAMLGAAGLAIGLALQGTLQNIAAGIMLLFLRPFRVGEYIDAEGISGTVDEIGLFTTHLTTYDGVYVETPNSNLWNRSVINYSRLPTRRLDIPVGIGYGDDIDKALGVLMDMMVKDGRVLKDPEPATMVLELADSSVNLNMRMWCDSSDFWGLKFDMTKALKQRLDAEGISIPFPQRDVHMYQETAAKP
jgi:small conductance mechanosensitive channel